MGITKDFLEAMLQLVACKPVLYRVVLVTLTFYEYDIPVFKAASFRWSAT